MQSRRFVPLVGVCVLLSIASAAAQSTTSNTAIEARIIVCLPSRRWPSNDFSAL